MVHCLRDAPQRRCAHLPAGGILLGQHDLCSSFNIWSLTQFPLGRKPWAHVCSRDTCVGILLNAGALAKSTVGRGHCPDVQIEMV